MEANVKRFYSGRINHDEPERCCLPGSPL